MSFTKQYAALSDGNPVKPSGGLEMALAKCWYEMGKQVSVEEIEKLKQIKCHADKSEEWPIVYRYFTDPVSDTKLDLLNFILGPRQIVEIRLLPLDPPS